jgi:hypothetical protein
MIEKNTIILFSRYSRFLYADINSNWVIEYAYLKQCWELLYLLKYGNRKRKMGKNALFWL